MGRAVDARRRRALWGVVGPVALVGSALLVWAWVVIAARGSWAVAITLGLAVAAAEMVPVRMREEVAYSFGSVVVFAAVLVGGAPLAVAAVTVGAVVGLAADVRAGRAGEHRLAKALFNTGQMAIVAAVAGVVFTSLVGLLGGTGAIASWTTGIALLTAAGIYTLANHVLVALPIRALTGERIRSTLRSVAASSILIEVLYAGLAILVVGLALHDPWALLLLVPPLAVARLALLGYERETSAYDRLVDALLKSIEVKDGYTAGHTERVSKLCVEVAADLGFGYEELRAVRYAAKLHDIGKLAVPTEVLNKPGALSADEFALIEEHPTVGADILEGITFLRPTIDGVRHHHERVDGGGYPAGLAGGELPMMARIITVCDAFDAMTTTRPYRRATDLPSAFEELRRCAGTQFDPEVVAVLERVTRRLDWQPTVEPYTPEVSR